MSFHAEPAAKKTRSTPTPAAAAAHAHAHPYSAAAAAAGYGGGGGGGGSGSGSSSGAAAMALDAPTRAPAAPTFGAGIGRQGLSDLVDEMFPDNDMMASQFFMQFVAQLAPSAAAQDAALAAMSADTARARLQALWHTGPIAGGGHAPAAAAPTAAAAGTPAFVPPTATASAMHGDSKQPQPPRRSRFGPAPSAPTATAAAAAAPTATAAAAAAPVLGVDTVHVPRADGAVRVYPNGHEATLPVSGIFGTHASVASGFSDGKSVEDTIALFVATPNAVLNDVFVLTVFRSTAPGDVNGAPRVWSMNNRRLYAMQQAATQLAARGQALPQIRVRWAAAADFQHALAPGKFMNAAAGPVGFHSSQSMIRRFAAASRIGAPAAAAAGGGGGGGGGGAAAPPPPAAAAAAAGAPGAAAAAARPSVQAINAALTSAEELAKLLDL